MNATQVLKKLIKQADSFDKTVITVTMYKELLRQAIKYDVNKDVPTIGLEDINKLQRYDSDEFIDGCGMGKFDDGEYIRYDSLISLLTK